MLVAWAGLLAMIVGLTIEFGTLALVIAGGLLFVLGVWTETE